MSPSTASSVDRTEAPRRRRSRRSRSLIVRLVGGGVCFWVAVALPAMAEDGPRQSLIVDGLTFNAAQGGQVQLSLWAERARVDFDAQVAALEQVHLSVPSDDGAAIEIRAGTGRLELGGHAFELRSGIRARLPDGRLLTTESVAYEAESRCLRGEEAVLLWSPIREGEQVSAAEGFEYSMNDRTLRLLGGTQLRSQVR